MIIWRHGRDVEQLRTDPCLTILAGQSDPGKLPYG